MTRLGEGHSRHKTVKLLSGIQYKAEESKRQVTTTLQVTTFQLPEAASQYWIHSKISTPALQPTQMAAPQQPTMIAKVQQPQRSASMSLQPASFIVVDDQQSGPSRKVMFALSPTKTFNVPCVTSRQQEVSQHNTFELSSLFGSIPSVLQYQQINTP